LGHDQQHFVYLAANGAIWDAFYCPKCSGNPWKLQKINLGGMTKGPAATSRPFVNEYFFHNQQHLAYTTKGGDVWDPILARNAMATSGGCKRSLPVALSRA
jgi:hypothetical protein